MPTVLRKGPYRFHFYSKEPNEPPHIHVERDRHEAKFWLQPISVGRNHGFSASELNKLARIVQQQKASFEAAWKQIHE